MTNDDWVPAPIFDTITAAGYVVDDVVLKPITTESPWADPCGLTVRSEDMAPLRIHRLASFTTPDWASVGAAGLLMSISYHRNSVRGPLATTCPVHTTNLWMRGSWAATAWVSRASSVSRRLPVPFCGALPGGTA